MERIETFGIFQIELSFCCFLKAGKAVESVARQAFFGGTDKTKVLFF